MKLSKKLSSAFKKNGKMGLAHLAISLLGCLYLAVPIYNFVNGNYLMRNAPVVDPDAKKKAVVELVKGLLFGLVLIVSANFLLHHGHSAFAVLVISIPLVVLALVWLSWVSVSDNTLRLSGGA